MTGLPCYHSVHHVQHGILLVSANQVIVLVEPRLNETTSNESGQLVCQI